jgi:hypothetical protein
VGIPRSPFFRDTVKDHLRGRIDIPEALVQPGDTRGSFAPAGMRW